MVKGGPIPHFTGQYPILQVYSPFSQFLEPALYQKEQIQSGKIKMIKRDWKLPNPSFFTYTSIVQPVLQVYNPFLQAKAPFSQLFGSKREKQLQNDTKGVDPPLQVILRPPNALMGSYTPFYKQTTHFYKPTGSFHSFKCSKFEAGKAATK